MNELDQLRAQLIELAAKNARLREALEFYKDYNHLAGEAGENNPDYDFVGVDLGGYPTYAEKGIVAAKALSQPTPTNAGAHVLELTKAAIKAVQAQDMIRWFLEDEDSTWETSTQKLFKIAKSFIENPELRQWLGVEE